MDALAADLAARASELDALGELQELAIESDAGPSPHHVEEVKRGDERLSEKAAFYLVRTDGYICTRETVVGAFMELLYPWHADAISSHRLLPQTRPFGSSILLLSSRCSCGRLEQSGATVIGFPEAFPDCRSR